MTLTQSGTAVQGTLEVSSFLASVSGPITTTGTLTLAGNGRAQATTMTVSNWSTVATGTAMTGTFSYTLAPDDASRGTVTVRAGLQDVVKTQ